MRKFKVAVLEKNGKIAETFQKFTLAVVIYAINNESISLIKLIKLEKPCKLCNAESQATQDLLHDLNLKFYFK